MTKYHPTYQERTRNNRVLQEEQIDGRNYRIESETEYDILNWDKYSIDIMNRNCSDEETITVEINGRDTQELINHINQL